MISIYHSKFKIDSNKFIDLSNVNMAITII